MPRPLFILPLLLLASCAADTSHNDLRYGAMQDGSPAPITHEPYGSEMRDFATHQAADLTWKPGPPSLPAGVQIAILEGDPSKEGPFVFRLKVPDGFTIAPHSHPRAERVTVLQGTFNIAEGDKLDKSPNKGRVMTAGSFGYWPARMHHYAWMGDGTGAETIAQFHGQGPWTIEYVNPQDDPRNAKKISSQTVEAGCGACIYKMPGVEGCPLAVLIDGKPYLVQGATWPNHDYCDRKCTAVVSGKLEGDPAKFIAASFEPKK